jgi:hypothetical protein
MISGRPISAIQFIFYTLLVAGATLTFTSVIRFYGTVWRQDQFVIFSIYYAVLLAEYFLQFWADKSLNHVDISRKYSVVNPIFIFLRAFLFFFQNNL